MTHIHKIGNLDALYTCDYWSIDLNAEDNEIYFCNSIDLSMNCTYVKSK